MSSTYSTNLRLELIGAGEQAGTWGATTNTNLGTLLDQAIAGYTTVAVASANQALTASNGGADESRNATIKLTTSTGANFAIYAPPVSKQYVIYNSSSYTATIYNSTVLGNTTAAGTGVTIPAGKTYTVWSDGTNFALSAGGPATDLSGGAANKIPYQTGSSATAFIDAPVSSGTFLGWDGSAFAWSAAGTGSVTSITAGTGLTGGTITTSGTVALATTAVSAGSYTNADITVDAYGRLTSAASGAGAPAHGSQVFTSSGTFTPPTGVTVVKVTVIGAGGNSGSAQVTGGCASARGGGGGAGGVSVGYVTVSGTATVTVGTSAGTKTSSFAGTSTLSATGGSNGTNAVDIATTATQGVDGTGTINGVTDYAYSFFATSTTSAVSAATYGSTLVNTVTLGAGKVKSSNTYGYAGPGRATAGAGNAGVGYGAGAGAPQRDISGTTAAASGANGIVIVEW